MRSGKFFPHIWNSWPRFAYSLYNFFGATIKINGVICKTVYGPVLKTTQFSACEQNHASPERCRKSFTIIFRFLDPDVLIGHDISAIRGRFLSIFTARRNARIASAVATAIPSVRASVCPSVCPSACLSVTRWYCVKMTARSTAQIALLYSKMCLVM